MEESFKLYKLKRQLKETRQSSDETHAMYLKRYTELEGEIRREEESLRYKDQTKNKVKSFSEKYPFITLGSLLFWLCFTFFLFGLGIALILRLVRG